MNPIDLSHDIEHGMEHMNGLDALPDSGFRFVAVLAKVRGFGTVPVRAVAICQP